ncbi:hypothetical protein SAE02_71980 [Skermanella aerolata]|uniref:Transposase IS110-like N-terminal domain-containing protein n=1 Tax=Skermanella aerolata TaxID=393310 RepID=A0A512E3M6_9PROT|nr:hypothetical protein SAE02_71980 [Skermanella aerolata]
MSTAFIGLDLAKSVFQVHGVDAQGKVVVTNRLRRDAVLAFFANLPVCVVGMEACAGSHFWAREIARLGHTVRLMAPQYVKPYVKRHKNDRADAEAICEAVQRPSMRFVAVKSEDQQSTAPDHPACRTSPKPLPEQPGGEFASADPPARTAHEAVQVAPPGPAVPVRSWPHSPA